MKKIEAIIRPEKVSDVRAALEAAGSPGLHVTEVEGYGKQKGLVQQWRGEQYRVEMLSKVKLEVIVPDKAVKGLVQAIVSSAQTGSVGDGKIFISPVENAVRIRTGEEGDSAL